MQHEWDIKLDTRAEIFQNLNHALGNLWILYIFNTKHLELDVRKISEAKKKIVSNINHKREAKRPIEMFHGLTAVETMQTSTLTVVTLKVRHQQQTVF